MAYAGDLTQSMNALSMEDECPEARERRLIAELLAENQILRHGLAEQYGRIIITREQLNQANFSRETILDCIKYLSQRMLGLIEEVHNHGESLATKRSLRICSTNLETFVKFLPHSVSQWNIA